MDRVGSGIKAGLLSCVEIVNLDSHNMSSTSTELTTGKDNFPLSVLITALRENQGLVHIDEVDSALTQGTNDSDLATDADWEKFWAAAKKINAPLTFLVEPTLTIEPDPRVSAGTVIAAISLAIVVAEKLWNFFSGFDDKAVSNESDTNTYIHRC